MSDLRSDGLLIGDCDEAELRRRSRLGLCIECGQAIRGPFSYTLMGRVHGAFFLECPPRDVDPKETKP